MRDFCVAGAREARSRHGASWRAAREKVRNTPLEVTVVTLECDSEVLILF